MSMCLLAETSMRVGDAKRASAIERSLRPYTDHVAVSYPEIAIGCVGRYAGLAAMTAGRHDEAETPSAEGDRARRAHRRATFGRPRPRRSRPAACGRVRAVVHP